MASLRGNLEEALTHRITNLHAQNMALAVICKEQTEILTFQGENANAPSTPDTLFEVGSITKTLTALLLSDMTLSGEVSLDDNINTYLPEGARVQSRDETTITLSDLATHTSGLPRLPDNGAFDDNPDDPYAHYTTPLLHDYLHNYTSAPRAERSFDYSNLGYGLLGHILSLAANEPFESLLSSRILTPLGMTNTSYFDPQNPQKQAATGHDNVGQACEPWGMSALAGCGGLRSSAQDMVRYLAAQMFPHKTSLANTITLSHEIRHTIDKNTHIGLGWFTQNITKDLTIIGHNGLTGGFQSFMGFNRDAQCGAMVLTNSQEGAPIIGAYVLDALARSTVPPGEKLLFK